MDEGTAVCQALFHFRERLSDTLQLAGAEARALAGKQPERCLRGQDQGGGRGLFERVFRFSFPALGWARKRYIPGVWGQRPQRQEMRQTLAGLRALDIAYYCVCRAVDGQPTAPLIGPTGRSQPASSEQAQTTIEDKSA